MNKETQHGPRDCAQLFNLIVKFLSTTECKIVVYESSCGSKWTHVIACCNVCASDECNTEHDFEALCSAHEMSTPQLIEYEYG